MLKALLLAAFAVVAVAGAAPHALAQMDQFVIVPDVPSGGGGGGNAGGGNAVTTSNLNVRAGPGTHYPVIDVLPRGEAVRIMTCQSNWCWINHFGPSGWVSESHLVRTGGGGGQVGPAPVPPPTILPPVPPPGQRRWVCFYEQERFRGAGLCASPGESNNNLGVWNNRIRSIQINGGMTVQVCTDRNFFNCSAFNRDQSRLPRSLSGNISAYRVFQ